VTYIICRETEKEFAHKMPVRKHLNLSQITSALLPLFGHSHISYAVGMGAGEEETCTKV
jgi:hypothetical protein